MALVKSKYAPDIYKALNGILMVYKPALVTSKELLADLRIRISDALNNYEPRPVAKRIVIRGDVDCEKSVAKVPNLADHPLVAGPRYLPWDLSMRQLAPYLGYRSSGLNLILVGTANRFYRTKLDSSRLVNIYHITGKFGYVMDTFFYDGKITDKRTYKHVRPGKMDAVLARIESTQRDRLFDASKVPMDSKEAYELAKSWPSRPPKMAKWPVIYRLRCIHFNLPDFKIEVTVSLENENYLAHLIHDIGQLLKSAAYVESIRRVKVGPFDVNDSLTDREWDLPSIVKHFEKHSYDYHRLHKIIEASIIPKEVRSEHRPAFLEQMQNQNESSFSNR